MLAPASVHERTDGLEADLHLADPKRLRSDALAVRSLLSRTVSRRNTVLRRRRLASRTLRLQLGSDALDSADRNHVRYLTPPSLVACAEVLCCQPSLFADDRLSARNCPQADRLPAALMDDFRFGLADSCEALVRLPGRRQDFPYSTAARRRRGSILRG